MEDKMVDWKNDEELFEMMKKEVYTGVLCDMLDSMGYSHQYLPRAIQALRPTDIMVGRAFPTIICDVYGEQEEPPWDYFLKQLIILESMKFTLSRAVIGAAAILARS
jgi:hypothetical protein